MSKCAKVHISIDTSMKRMGFDPGDDFSFLNKKEFVTPVSVCTHLSKSDNFFIRKTLKTFLPCVENIKRFTGKDLTTHIFASGAVETLLKSGKAIDGDYVRPGLLCYGIEQFFKIGVKPALKVFSVVLAVNKVEKGQSVGYGEKYVFDKDGYVFCVEGGYFDGIFPVFVGGYVEINKKKCKIVSVCMDCFSAFDTGRIAEKGDRVEIINENLTVKETARRQHRIPYELLTSFQGRAIRRYRE